MSKQVDQFDVVVVGMGPGGAVLTNYLARAGVSVLGIERDVFPRYHVGESLTGIAAQVITDLGLEEAVEAIPGLPKPGVKVIGTNARSRFFLPVARPTWQVRRAQFDDLLLHEAREAGTHLRVGAVREVLQEGGRVVGVRYDDKDLGRSQEVRARFVVDCSGQSTLFSRLGLAGSRKVDVFGKQIAVFSQFAHAERDEEDALATYIFYSKQFHWAWFIPISETVTSVGVVVPSHVFRTVGDSPEEVYEWGIEHVNPDLRRRIQDPRKRVESVRAIRNFSYRVEPFAGPGWACVGDAHRFTDPIFSFGVSVAMTEAKAASEMILRSLREEENEQRERERYVVHCNRGQNAVHDLIRYFWTFPSFFAFQTRGKYRPDFIQLFAGDVYRDPPLQALESMRRSLTEVKINPELATQGDAIAQRLKENEAALARVRSAYIEYTDTGIRVSFFLKDGDLDNYEALDDLERRLYGEFGREELAVVSYPPDLAEKVYGAATTRDLIIPGGRRVFEHMRAA